MTYTIGRSGDITARTLSIIEPQSPRGDQQIKYSVGNRAETGDLNHYNSHVNEIEQNIVTIKGSFQEDWENMADPSVMEAVSSEMTARVQNLREQCVGNEKEENPRPYQFFMDVKELNLRWCKISKVGSTTWNTYLSQFAPLCEGGRVWAKYCVPEQWALEYPHKLTRKEWKTKGRILDFNKDTFNLLIVRHPFERIVSAYQSKFENNRYSGYKYFKVYGKDAMLKYRVVPENLTEGDKEALLRKTSNYIESGMSSSPDPSNPYENPPWPTFSELSAAILFDGIYERHWWPIDELCLPCSINYTAIAWMSTLDRDSAFVMRSIGINETGWPIQSNASPGKPTEEVWKEYFSTLSRELMEKYMTFYQKDCTLFGFHCDISRLKISTENLRDYVEKFFPEIKSSVSNNPHNFFGPRTPYRLVAGNISTHTFPCKPTALFSLHRHGMRNLGAKSIFISRISDTVNRLKLYYQTHNKPVAVNMDWLHNFTYETSTDKDLTPEGYIELFGQGERYKIAFPDLLKDPGHVQVSSSKMNRCISSAASFLKGLYNSSYYTTNSTLILDGDINRIVGNVTRECSKGDRNEIMCSVYQPILSPSTGSKPLKMFNPARTKLLNFYYSCKGCKIEDNLTYMSTDDIPDKYTNDARLSKLVNDMSTRLELKLVLDDVIVMHILCTLELTVPRLVKGAKFCSVFRGEELYILGFFRDLLLHQTTVSPARVNASCVIMQEVLHTFRGHDRSFYFTHSQAIWPLLEYINVVPGPLVRWQENIKERTLYGDTVPYGSSFTMVTMEQCANNGGGTIVQTFLNEKLIEFPGCGDPCRLDRLEEMFPANQCHYSE